MAEPFELSLTQAAAEIAARRLSSVELTGSLLARIEALEPRLQAWATLLPEQALARCPRRGRGRRRLARPARGRPLWREGHLRHGRRPYGGGLEDMGRARARRRRRPHRARAERGRGAAGQAPYHRVRRRRPRAVFQPLERRAHAWRLQHRLRRRGRGAHGPVGVRLADRRLRVAPRLLQRRRWLQAHVRAHPAARRRADGHVVRSCRRARAARRGRCAVVERLLPRTTRTTRSPPTFRRTTTSPP